MPTAEGGSYSAVINDQFAKKILGAPVGGFYKAFEKSERARAFNYQNFRYSALPICVVICRK